MEAAARRCLRFLHRLVGQEVSDLRNQPRACKGLLNVITLEVNVGIDFVGDAIVALVAFKTYVVRSSADPDGCTVHLKRRFPNTQMIARFDDADRLSVGPAVILGAAKK